jgi:FkbM family methyltransferase
LNPINWVLSPLGLIFTRKRNIDPGLRLSIARSHVIRTLDIKCTMDIGANRGQWALGLLNSGYAEDLISFEPTKSAFVELERESSRFTNWNVYNFAIGPIESESDINISANSELSSSLLEMGEEHSIAAPHANFVRTERIKVRLLGPYLNLHKSIYLKIDAQGYESRILESIPAGSWSSIMALEIEVSLVDAYVGSEYIENVIQFLRLRGFRPYRIENGLARSGFGQQIQVDIIFVREIHGANFH